MSTFEFNARVSETARPARYAPQVELSEFVSLPAAVVPDVNPEYAAIRCQGGLDERAIMSLWLQRTEVVMFMLTRLDNSKSNLEIIRSKFDNMLAEVFPTCNARIDPEDLRTRFETALGLHSAVDPMARASGVTARVDLDRQSLNSAFQRLVYTSQTSMLGGSESPWNFIEARCLRIIAPLVERLGESRTFERILSDPQHPRFSLVLGMTRDIAEKTSPLVAVGEPERLTAEQMEMRKRLIGNLSYAVPLCEELGTAHKIIEVLEAFEVDALPAFDYLLDSAEVDPGINRSVLNAQVRITRRAAAAAVPAEDGFCIMGHDPKLFAI